MTDAPINSEAFLMQLFAAQRVDDLRYVAKWGQWFVWDNMRWGTDDVRRVFTLACDLCVDVASGLNNSRERKQMATAKTRAAVVSLASEDPRLAATVDQWDADPWLLNTPDGTIDLRTGCLHEHRREDYITKITSVGPRGKCPRWRKFLEEITNADVELQKYLQRVAGYCLTGVTYEQQLFFNYGAGGNGKGVFVGAICGILHDYHRTAQIETFTVNHGERHPTELAGLRGARLVTAAETEEGRRWSEARIKELTGGDKITARFMRQDFFDFVPQFKLMFSGNHMPTLRTVNKAITRRFNRIPFTVTIPDGQVNKNLADELKVEWPGILQWAVEGCLQWQRIGLCPPACVSNATASYLEGEDIIGEWIDECCERDAAHWESATDLFLCWQSWTEERSEYVGSVKWFSLKLEDRGGLKRSKNKEQTARGFYGLRLKTRPAREQFGAKPNGKGAAPPEQPGKEERPATPRQRHKPRGVRF
jgi:putative DNA primase/helicase